MKIALPTRDGRIDDHFGHCDHYTIVSVEGGKVIATEDMPSPEAAAANPTSRHRWRASACA